MRRHLIAIAAAAALALASPPADAASPPQVLDPPNDANAGTHWGQGPDRQTPVGSQAYADVTSVLLKTTKATRRVRGRNVTSVTGFTVTMTLTEPPTPPPGTVAVYRVLGFSPACLFGVDYYTSDPAAGVPRSAFQNWCDGTTIRRIPLPLPTIRGATITWAVPLATVPHDAGIRVGSRLTDLHFEALLIPHPAACARTSPGAEQTGCGVMLDTTFGRDGTYSVR